MKWWENEIDGYSLEWQNHESDNKVLLHADLISLPRLVKSHFGGTVMGISKNPPIGGRPCGNGENFYAVCFDVDGDLRWFHILKDQFILWLDNWSQILKDQFILWRRINSK